MAAPKQQTKDAPPPRTANPTATQAVAEHGLPGNPEAERSILGSILLNDDRYAEAESLKDSDFSSETHRRIWLRMGEIRARAERIDRVSLATELNRFRQLESIGGLTFLSTLGDGLPDGSIVGWVRIVKECSIRRRFILMASEAAKSAVLNVGDAKDILDGMAAQVQALQEEAHGSDADDDSTPERIVSTFPGGINSFLDPGSRPRGLMSGIVALDEMTGGFRGGQVIVIAGRTSSGKSALALNIAEYQAFLEEPKKTAYFSLEMPRADLLNRMIASRAKVDSFRIRNNFINQDERKRMATALYEVTQAPLLFFDERQKKLNDLLATMRKVVKKSGVRMAVIDHLGYVRTGESRRSQNRAQEIADFAQQIKLAALEMNIPIMLLAQLSRRDKASVGKPPVLEDLKDSSEIEQSADVVLMIFREFLYRNDRDDLRDKATIFIRKQRDGAIGSAKVRFKEGITWFFDLGNAEESAQGYLQD